MKNELLLPTGLMCGYFDCSAFGSLKVSPERTCATFEIEFFLEDGRNTFSDGNVYPIRRNFALICTPGEKRHSDLPFKTKYLHFYAEGKLAEILKKAPRYFHVSQSLEANALLDEIITIHTVQGCDDILLSSKFLSYISLLLENAKCSEQVNSAQNETVVRSQEFIKEHYADPIKLSDIARAVNLSPNYFHAVFSEVCGITPREYLEEYRVKIAQSLLLTTQLSIGEIAEQCGFKSQQYLSAVFRTRLGCSPTRFKRQHQDLYLI